MIKTVMGGSLEQQVGGEWMVERGTQGAGIGLKLLAVRS